MDAARALQQGELPSQVAHQDRYAVRSGACVTSKAKDLPAVMLERFGDAAGFVGRPQNCRSGVALGILAEIVAAIVASLALIPLASAGPAHAAATKKTSAARPAPKPEPKPAAWFSLKPKSKPNAQVKRVQVKRAQANRCKRSPRRRSLPASLPNSACSWMSAITSESPGAEQRAQRRRIRLQPAARKADRGAAEIGGLCRNPPSDHRGQGEAEPVQARQRRQRRARRFLPLDPSRLRAGSCGSRGSSKRGKAISATASAATRPSCSEAQSALRHQPDDGAPDRQAIEWRAACNTPPNTPCRSWAAIGRDLLDKDVGVYRY